jgi:fucose 4-O-acetylase-like acetyltransferase
MSRRLVALDMTKGTAIFLVVVGHIVSRNDIAPGAEWYADLRAGIYLFHMPLFMALSGLALGLSWRHRAHLSEVGGLVAQRLRQFAVPFFAFALIILAGKLLAQQWVQVNNPPGDFLHSLTLILLTPIQSSSGFLWYLQVLATYYLVMPWLLQASQRWAPWALLLLGVLVQAGDWTPWLSLNLSAEYLPFFAGGLLLGQHWPWVQAHMLPQRSWPLWLLPLAAVLIYSHIASPLPKWLAGALSIPCMLSLHQNISGTLQRWLTTLGKYTLAIYLMNTAFIGLAKAALKPFVPWEGAWFNVYFVVLCLAGLLLPMIVKQTIARVRPAWANYL